uniref:Uncharacterized protein n=1 Tax=viral metagenome TaxID=1070528 RepID=A0A6C0CS16_9ZZZZ
MDTALKIGTTSTTYQTFRTMNAGLCRVIAVLWDKLSYIFRILGRFLFLTRSPAAYVVWLLIILAIIMGVGFGIGFNGGQSSTLVQNTNVEDKNSKKKKPKSSALSEQPTNDGYRKKAVQQSVSGEPNKVDGYKRNLLSGGRCDGLNWITDPDYEKNCIKHLRPPSINWEFNSDQYNDLGDIPEEILKNQLKGQSSISIPYKLDKDRYYVDCSNMKYENGNIASLFKQKNIKDSLCQFIEKSPPSFTDKKRLSNSVNRYKICT